MTEVPLFLAEASLYCELALQEMWHSIPKDVIFKLQTGGSFRVISRGTWNHAAGPDFLNAKLELDGTIVAGDIEIHRKTSHWAEHGHHGDPAYTNVILHVVGNHDISPAKASKLPLIPIYVLPHSFADIQTPLNTTPDGLCAAFFARLSDEAIHKFVSDAGLERFRIKSKALLTEMIARGTKEAFVRRLFEQVGIPGNRSQFQELAQRLLAYPEDARKNAIQAILWGESGCLPDPAKTALSGDAAALVGDLWNQWWQIRRLYEKPISFSHRARPLNSISRRIAILSAFIRTFGENPLPDLLSVIESSPVETAMETLWEKITLKDAFWEKHTSFTSAELKNPAQLLGHDRITELLIDVIIPAIHAFASVSGEFKLIAKIESLYLAMPKTASNKSLREIAERCFPGRSGIFKTAAAQQGLLHIRKTWCSPLACNCKACPIYQLV
ncbi:MAG: DUF2851 family protein [Lentisphaeria bacterium]|nr:DUF2851 family protein [Lentisphaeria bacterium]